MPFTFTKGPKGHIYGASILKGLKYVINKVLTQEWSKYANDMVPTQKKFQKMPTPEETKKIIDIMPT